MSSMTPPESVVVIDDLADDIMLTEERRAELIRWYRRAFVVESPGDRDPEDLPHCIELGVD